MKLTIYCEECREVERMKDKYTIVTFDDLSGAVFHIVQYGHTVKIELEEESEEDE